MKVNWRVTDNRHWNSPARMSDGRLFTNYKSPAVVALDLEKEIGISKGLQTWRDYLQKNAEVIQEQRSTQIKASAHTSDIWADSYVPPGPKYVVKDKQVKETNIVGGIGSQVTEVREQTKNHERQTPYSGPPQTQMNLDDPRWGITPETLVLTKRNAVSQGGSVWGWLDDRH